LYPLKPENVIAFVLPLGVAEPINVQLLGVAPQPAELPAVVMLELVTDAGAAFVVIAVVISARLGPDAAAGNTDEPIVYSLDNLYATDVEVN
jgi:hypothetical protein